jgi:subtilase family serine protease
MDTCSVGVNGATFGLTNSSTWTVLQLLLDLNSNTTGGAAVASGANAVFSGINSSGNVTNADLSSVGLAYTPAQIRTAYGVNSLPLDGTGQTIAIVDAYDNPAIYQALDTYDRQFAATSSGPTLYQQYGPASAFLTVLNQNGQSSSLPTTDPSGAGTANWETEEALDVEWTHALAPGAQIMLVEANSQSLSDLMAAVVAAAGQPGVSVVSMSWGFPEGQSVFASDEALYDRDFTTPAGHQGVTFVASTGDYGTADPEYPAFSPNVLAVGGTSLYVNADNSYGSETGWGYYSASAGTLIGSGGGTSLYEAEPAYQQGVQATGARSTPDVSFVADPSTGAWIADPYNLPADNAFEVVGGTSLSAPCWAGLVALANQGRVAAGQATLNSTTPTDAQQALYSLPGSDFNSIASGSNGGYRAGAGYNMVTGLGTPQANLVVPAMASYQQCGDSYVWVPPAATAGTAQQNPGAANGAGPVNVVNVFDALTVAAHAPSVPYASPGPAAPGDAAVAGAPALMFFSQPAHAAAEASPGTIATPADKRDAADSAVGILLPAVTTNGVLDRLDGIDMAAGDVIFSRLCVDDGSAVGVLPDLALADPGSDANDAVLQAVWSEWAPGTC